MRNGSTAHGSTPPESTSHRVWEAVTPPAQQGYSQRRIGEVVVELGFADSETVEAAVETARDQRKPTGQVLLDGGVITHDQLARVVAQRLGMDYVDLSVYEPEMEAVNLIDADAAKRYQAVPIALVGDQTVLLAMADPTNVLTVDDIGIITGLRIRPAVASPDDIRMLISRLGRMSESIEDVVDVEEPEADLELDHREETEAPVIKLVHSIIGQAIEQGASDIHIDPEDADSRVHFRIDGILYPAVTVKRKMASGVVSRVKIMANLDIAERRRPQDGRLAVTVDGRRVDLRVVTLPLVNGEAVVMRILDKGVVVRDLDALGMLEEERARFATAIGKSQGAVLVTGPTGSGKTTTLYAALGALNSGERSILTIEDPVESRMAGIKQMQTAAKVGITFGNGLRTMLRADPDVMMVGEIRDSETAQIAVEAALTGHLVLSTLHTRDAPSALVRLADMGVEPFLVSSAIDCVVAQRLARTLCPDCKRPMKLTPAVLEEHGLGDIQPHEPVGCARCAGTGYRGRVGLYEVILMTEEIRTLVLKRATVDEIASLAVEQGMRRLAQDGLEKVKTGQTSIAEIERISSSLL